MNTPWHQGLMWFLAALAIIALADVAPNIATWIMVLIIILVFFKNQTAYMQYLGLVPQAPTKPGQF